MNNQLITERRLAMLEQKIDDHCQNNEEHFSRIEKNQESMNEKLDMALKEKADKKEVDELSNQVGSIKLSIAKWTGGAIIILYILQQAISYLIKHF